MTQFNFVNGGNGPNSTFLDNVECDAFSVSDGQQVGYVTTPAIPMMPIGGKFWVSYNLSGNGIWLPIPGTDDGPAQVTLFAWRRGDNLSGEGQYAYYRWWAYAARRVMPYDGSYLLYAPIDPAQWSSVFGERGNNSAAATAGFNAAMNDLQGAGFTFGGLNFFGHGCTVQGGTQTFRITGGGTN